MSYNAKTTKAIVRFNKEQGGIEVEFPQARSLSAEELNVLKNELHMGWHRYGKYWFARYTDASQLDAIKQSFIGKEPGITFPKSGTDVEKKVLATGAQKAQEQAERKAQRSKEKKPSQIQEMRDMIAQQAKENAELRAMFAQFMSAQTGAKKA